MVLYTAFLMLAFLTPTISSKYFSFYNQSTKMSSGTELDDMNYALLNFDVNPPKTFSICSSLRVHFIRGDLAFFAIAKKNAEELWITFLLILEKGFSEPKYSFWFYASGTTYVLPGSGNCVKMHAWNHVCLSIDLNSGWMAALVNGEVVHNESMEELRGQEDVGNFRDNLLLGLTWKGGSSIQQSEGGVGGLQLYNEVLSLEAMKEATSSGVFPKNPLLSWDPSYWTIHGSVTLMEDKQEKEELTLFPKVKSLDSCVQLCSKVQRGGQVPSVTSSNQSLNLVEQFRNMMKRVTFIPAAYSDVRNEGHFEDIYTREPINMNLFAAGEPNGEQSENCVAWSVRLDGSLVDISCDVLRDWQCFCKFNTQVLLTLRGLCPESRLDTFYTINNLDGEIVFKGLTGSEIDPQGDRWIAKSWRTRTKNIQASKSSYLLGKHTWTIQNDSAACHTTTDPESESSSAYQVDLKMTSCKVGEFTCRDGACIRMANRCNQVADCIDKSDERDCKIVVLEEGYNKRVPPIKTVSPTNHDIHPVQVNVSMALLKVVRMDERKHSIEFQFKIVLKWMESRAVYHNLKEKTSLNSLTEEEIRQLWLPLIIYANTDQKETTRLGLLNEWSTSVTVTREGEFVRSGLEVVDEVEIFKGEENRLTMNQTYTHRFQCYYQLMEYPFDRQVDFNRIN